MVTLVHSFGRKSKEIEVLKLVILHLCFCIKNIIDF